LELMDDWSETELREAGLRVTRPRTAALAVRVDASLTRQIGPAGLAVLLETRTGDNHHQFVCRACGRSTDLDRATWAQPCHPPSDGAGDTVDEAEVVFWGMCPNCQQKQEPRHRR
jgi:Fur family transcriptional regulator, stress-responsive regulator